MVVRRVAQAVDVDLRAVRQDSARINGSPDGANVVIVHNIKTTLDSETLRYIAAVKGKALLDESPDPSLPRKAATS